LSGQVADGTHDLTSLTTRRDRPVWLTVLDMARAQD
jgi:hypothetical protein